jgi:uncharacterized protein YqjF (DUF2071 family)
MNRKPAASERVVMRSAWHHLLFLHWEMEPGILQEKLPAGLQIDTFEDRAFVGLVPFTMTAVRPHGLPHLPPLRRWHEDFHEINVRTYVRHEKHGPGVWFFSLDAASAPAVVTARNWFKLPYFYARMSLLIRREMGNETMRYASRRQWPQPLPAACDIEYSPQGETSAAQPGTLEYFLIERYLLYSFWRGQLFVGRVRHKPYPIQSAQLHSVRENLITAAGITRPNAPPLAHYSRGVKVDIGKLRRAN